MLNSDHRGLHGHGHFHQGLHCGILHLRRHGENPNKLPHLMFQQLVLNTTKNRSELLRRESDTADFVFNHSLN